MYIDLEHSVWTSLSDEYKIENSDEVEWAKIGLEPSEKLNLSFSKFFYVIDKKLFFLAKIKHGFEYEVLSEEQLDEIVAKYNKQLGWLKS